MSGMLWMEWWMVQCNVYCSCRVLACCPRCGRGDDRCLAGWERGGAGFPAVGSVDLISELITTRVALPIPFLNKNCVVKIFQLPVWQVLRWARTAMCGGRCNLFTFHKKLQTKLDNISWQTAETAGALMIPFILTDYDQRYNRKPFYLRKGKSGLSPKTKDLHTDSIIFAPHPVCGVR